MRNNMLFLFLLLSMPVIAKDKSKKLVSRTTLESGFTLSTNGAMNAAALHGVQYWGIGKSRKPFKLGLGLRFTSSLGSSTLQYITAPASITSGKTGPGVFFASNIPNNIDTVKLNGTQVNALNVVVHLNTRIYKKWSAEFNIDAVGFSFGSHKNATLFYGDGTKQQANFSAKPTAGNALLISDNDLGSLNSEFKLFYQVGKKSKVNAGLAFLFNEYKLGSTVKYVNSLGTAIEVDRYRTKALLFALGYNVILK